MASALPRTVDDSVPTSGCQGAEGALWTRFVDGHCPHEAPDLAASADQRRQRLASMTAPQVEACRAASDIVTQLVASGAAPSGSLRVFGDWFGRPHDNVHRPVSADSSGPCLIVHFDGDETLRVWEPEGITITASKLLVRGAARVRWEWFSYGSEQTPENLFVEEHWVEDGRVRASSTATWYQPSFSPSLVHPAVELL